MSDKKPFVKPSANHPWRKPMVPLPHQGVIEREPQPTGWGERSAAENQSGWSYDLQAGFKMIDGPLGVPYPESLREGLARSRFCLEPSMRVGTGPVRMEAYERTTSSEWLVVVFTGGPQQLVLASNFVAAMEVMERWRSVVAAASEAASPPKPDGLEGWREWLAGQQAKSAAAERAEAAASKPPPPADLPLPAVHR